MNLETYLATFKEDQSPGWLAIDAAMAGLYGPGEPLAHFTSDAVPPVLGGHGPDGTSVFQARGHLHYVTYGFSTLHYDPSAAGREYSGAGFELTLRVAGTAAHPDAVPRWPMVIFRNLYDYISRTGKWFEPGQGVPSTKTPIDQPENPASTSELTGIVFTEDPELGTIATPHGKVQFVQLAPITRAECAALTSGSATYSALIDTLRAADPLLITHLARR